MANNTNTHELLQLAFERATEYIESLETRPVAPDPEGVERLSELDVPLPEGTQDPKAVLEKLYRTVTPATMAMAGPRFFGFVIGGALPVTVASSWLTTAWEQNTGMYHGTPATARLEQVALRWLLELFGLPAESDGAFVTGASVANFTSLVAARNVVMAREGWNVRKQGLRGAPPLTVVIGKEAHPVVFKALALLGIGTDQLIEVEVDRQGRMRPDRLPRIDGPTIVIAQVGNVNTGACDAIGEICTRVKGTNTWVHVDGAFGLWARVAPKRRYLVEGVELADSWATDAHKWLNVPYDCGLAFVRHKDALRQAMAVTAAYLPSEAEFRNPSDYTPELSRRARGVDVWTALYHLGRSGVEDMIERMCQYAELFAEALSKDGYEILNDVVLNQVLVSFGSEELNEAIAKGIREDGTCWAATTKWQGQSAMRISISCWATTEKDVEMSVEAMKRVAKRVRVEAGVR